MSNKPLVLITGCAGFLGSHLMSALAEKEIDMLGIDKAAGYGVDILTEKGIFGLKKELDKIKNKDIYLLHLMGMADAGECEKNPALAYDLNVRSTQELWKLAEEYGMKKVVYPSTALVYGTKYEEAVNEEFPSFPENTYARNKLEAENYIVSNAADSKVASVILRISNIYGPGMNKNTVVNTIVKQLKAGNLKLKEYRSVRDHVYVDDVIKALILAVFSRCRFKVYNVAGSRGYSVWELAREIARITGKTHALSVMKLKDEDTKGGSRLVLNCERIKNDLKWSPAYDLESGIKRMLNA